MFVSSPHRANSRRTPRLSTFATSVWSLLLAACGGGGGGGGPVASAPKPEQPRKDPSIQLLPALRQPVGDDGAPSDPGSSPNDQQNRDGPPSDARQVQAQATDLVAARLEILPLVSLPTRPTAGTDQWIKIADIRVLNDRGEAIQGDWNYTVDDPARFRADNEGLHVRVGSDFRNSVSENLNVRITLKQATGNRVSQITEVEIVNRAESLEAHIYEHHPFHKPIAYLTAASGWVLDGHQGDNALFHVDSTGRVWFIGTSRVPLLDFERPADSDGNNIYQLRLTRIVDGHEEALNLSVQVHNIVNERNWAQRHDYRGLLGRSREADLHHEVPDELEHVMHGSHWLLPSSGPLVLTWSLRTLFSPDQVNAGLRPSRSQLLADRWPGRDGQPVVTDQRYMDSVREIEALRQEFNSVFEALERHVNVRFIEVMNPMEAQGIFGSGYSTIPTKASLRLKRLDRPGSRWGRGGNTSSFSTVMLHFLQII